MAVDDDPDDPDADEAAHDAEEAAVERPLSLNDQRMNAVLDALRGAGARTVVDLGCGEGRLVRKLLREPWVDRVVGVDVSWRALEFAARRMKLHEMAPRQRERVELRQGALTYRDRKLGGFDAATVVEVVEHLDPPRLAAFERVVFLHARPRVVVVTTPNVEHNVRFETLPAGMLRHRDHRFEWTRAEFAAWANSVGDRRGYRVEFGAVGNDDPEVGPPTQMAVFTR
jgi:3' terminal RNA ribose 2'-O-methyltransferase Hen1